jgi:CRP-like cAMP-binding protein
MTLMIDSLERVIPSRDSQPRNRLLAALPSDERERLSSDLRLEPFRSKQLLHNHGEPLRHVYFPAASLCSASMAMDDGHGIQVAIIGDEGLVGIAAVLGDGIAIGRASVQVPGDGAYAMSIETFHREMARGGVFHDLMSQYSRAFVQLLLQSVACNGLHSAKERCCRQLLMIGDRLGRDQFALTHDALAMALGVRRPTVTIVMDELTAEGIVETRRGQVAIRERARLEAASCECYRRARNLFVPRAA